MLKTPSVGHVLMGLRWRVCPAELFVHVGSERWLEMRVYIMPIFYKDGLAYVIVQAEDDKVFISFIALPIL